MSNLSSIDGDGKRDKLRESLRQLERDLPVLLEMQKLSAQMIRAKFESLVAEGFTETQALELCK